MSKVDTTSCVVGGGPAGMMLGYLLARAGVDVTVLEKHADFFRDFRGDTVHPSTLELLYELSILDDFLKIPHQQISSAGGHFGDFQFRAADFSSVPTHCKFAVLMPQWDFLDFLKDKAKSYSGFHLRMQSEAVDLLREGPRVRGVVVKTPKGHEKITADLTVGCDGRHSSIRDAANFEVIESGVPIDVLWFRISRKGDEGENLLGNVNYGGALVMIPRDEYFQSALVVRKGSFEQIRKDGLEAFRARVRQIAPSLGDRVEELRDWEQIKLLSVQINRLRQWHRPGLLCIGDAAHAMSPMCGVGINLAIQDAVAAANLLADPLRKGRVTEASLAAVQQRREFPTRATQFVQVNAHKALEGIFHNPGPVQAPWQLKAMVAVPGIQRVMGYVVGVGFRPEHIAGARKPAACPMPKLGRIAIAAGLAIAGVAIGLRLLRKSRKPSYGWT